MYYSDKSENKPRGGVYFQVSETKMSCHLFIYLFIYFILFIYLFYFLFFLQPTFYCTYELVFRSVLINYC